MYAQLIVAPKMQQLNQEVKEVEEQSVHIQATMVTLSPNTCRAKMKENTTLVACGEAMGKTTRITE